MKKHNWEIKNSSRVANMFFQYGYGVGFLDFHCKDCGTFEIVSKTNEEEKKLLLDATNCDKILVQKAAKRLLG